VDRRIHHENTKLTHHSRTAPSLEHRPDRRPEKAAQAQTRLGDQGTAGAGREPPRSAPFQSCHRQQAAWLRSDENGGDRCYGVRSSQGTSNLRAVQLLLGHTKMDSTVRYLGVELEDALAISPKLSKFKRLGRLHRRPTAAIHPVLRRRAAASPKRSFRHTLIHLWLDGPKTGIQHLKTYSKSYAGMKRIGKLRNPRRTLFISNIGSPTSIRATLATIA